LQELASGESPVGVWESVVEMQMKAKEAASKGQAKASAAPQSGWKVVETALVAAEPLDKVSGLTW
jgi:hypothetical protein